MSVKITALSENISDNPELLPDFGLSLYIEINDKTILLDTGSTGKCLNNAEKLGFDLSKLDAVVLSRWRILGGSVEDFPRIHIPAFSPACTTLKNFFEKMHKTSCNLKNNMVQYRRKRQKASEACLPKRRPQRVLQGPPGQLWR